MEKTTWLDVQVLFVNLKRHSVLQQSNTIAEIYHITV